MPKLSIYRSVEHPGLASKFQQNHEAMLAKFGIKNVSSTDRKWSNNPDSYFFLLEDSFEEYIAGMRLEIGSPGSPLPLHSAVNHLLDKKQQEKLFEEYTDYTIAEMCGMWSKRQTANKGISVLKFLQCSLAVAPFLGIDKIYGFGAASNVRLSRKLGFKEVEFLGDKGAFAYPSSHIKSTIMFRGEMDYLEDINEKERHEIMDLRAAPIAERTEQTKFGALDMSYDLMTHLPIYSEKLGAKPLRRKERGDI